MDLPFGVESRILRLPGPCWIWTGAKNPRGYGNIGFQGKTYKAHRFVYETLVGPIPKGMTLDHLCFNPLCVNPEHLEPCTNRENNLRGNSLGAQRARQTHCINGHPFDEANTGIRPNGTRRCRACAREAMAAKRAKKKAQAMRDEWCGGLGPEFCADVGCRMQAGRGPGYPGFCGREANNMLNSGEW